MELTASVAQTVEAGRDVMFTDTAVRGNCSMLHREGSGLVTLRGMTRQCRALYQCEYSGNIAVADGGTAGEISLALAVDGEALGSATGIATPAAAGDYFNVSFGAQVEVHKGCCIEVSVQNTSGQAIDVQNSNLTVTRIA